MRSLVSAAVLALALTACGGGESDGESGGSATTEPSTPDSSASEATSVTVVLSDANEGDLLFSNLGDGECTTRSIEETFGGNDATPVSVSLRSASGEIVGSKKLPYTGGVYTEGEGCRWEIAFDDVPASDFYEANVTGYNFDQAANAPAGTPIEFNF